MNVHLCSFCVCTVRCNQRTWNGADTRSNIKFTLVQATEVQRRSNVLLYSFFDLDARWGCVVNATPRPLCPREAESLPIVQEAGWATGPVWTGAENLAPQWDSIPRPSKPSDTETPKTECRTSHWVMPSHTHTHTHTHTHRGMYRFQLQHNVSP